MQFLHRKVNAGMNAVVRVELNRHANTMVLDDIATGTEDDKGTSVDCPNKAIT